MAKRATHTVGLDIGTSRVSCIIGEMNEATGLLEIVGIGEAESRGLRKGVVVNPEAAVDAISRAVEEAERMSGLEAEAVTINLAGTHIMGLNGQAVVAVSGRDREITADDVRRAIDSACAVQLPAGREIVDRLPQEFIVDDQDGINDPVGMIGARLAVRVHIITSPVTARQNAINAVNRAGLIVADMILSQLAAAEAALTEEEKEFGAALVSIGAETTGLVIYQRGAVQHTAVFALGGAHFTNDIAFGLRTPVPEAEKIKRAFGYASSANLHEAERGEMIEVPSVGGRPPRQLSRQILCDILQPRAEEVLTHVADEIREAGWERQLSSGVVLTGGGAMLGGMIEIAEQVFDAPVRLGYPERDRFGGLIEDIQSPAWTTAAGLCLIAQRALDREMRAAHAPRRGATRLTHLVSRFRDRFSGIF
ncbi:cell division protein FtsA [Pyrinomonas methylaliphatogenes]|jgi:cell division protein FtsA|uniref:Cell division protein FtsA n=1 Tax=Pyrinomonas methylaliphatogenes TaxID=454194 RepID=A0A0B6X1B9_9BACT|nr:cell division protein FtsA [Pyrinomonas methylaliphatogenes]MBX5477725.1 cell division protein FtsA [Pyrinomonas methylaliphatogenes]CDM67086.1 cell division protein FtsA [Pyrinomonas methylaliphatogenes]